MDCRKAASVGSGCGVGSSSISNAALDAASGIAMLDIFAADALANAAVDIDGAACGDGVITPVDLRFATGGWDTPAAIGAKDVLGAAFPVSAFLSSPRATRSVPLDCSTLTGFVNTRLAPILKALATPACPSTTATARQA